MSKYVVFTYLDAEGDSIFIGLLKQAPGDFSNTVELLETVDSSTGYRFSDAEISRFEGVKIVSRDLSLEEASAAVAASRKVLAFAMGKRVAFKQINATYSKRLKVEVAQSYQDTYNEAVAYEQDRASEQSADEETEEPAEEDITEEPREEATEESTEEPATKLPLDVIEFAKTTDVQTLLMKHAKCGLLIHKYRLGDDADSLPALWYEYLAQVAEKRVKHIAPDRVASIIPIDSWFKFSLAEVKDRLSKLDAAATGTGVSAELPSHTSSFAHQYIIAEHSERVNADPEALAKAQEDFQEYERMEAEAAKHEKVPQVIPEKLDFDAIMESQPEQDEETKKSARIAKALVEQYSPENNKQSDEEDEKDEKTYLMLLHAKFAMKSIIARRQENEEEQEKYRERALKVERTLAKKFNVDPDALVSFESIGRLRSNALKQSLLEVQQDIDKLKEKKIDRETARPMTEIERLNISISQEKAILEAMKSNPNSTAAQRNKQRALIRKYEADLAELG
jgi:hypothetical protein